jgi:aspartate/methionine/tyrosine aminotransferase
MDRVRAHGLEAAEPQGGLYLWLRSPWPDALQLIDALATRRVLLTPGIAFGVPSHLRLCFSAPRPKLTMAMDALAELALERVSA